MSRATRQRPGTAGRRPTEGAVAFLDALGFKGIWKQKGVTHAGVAAKLAQVKADATAEARRVRRAVSRLDGEELRVHMSFLSDTVVMAAANSRKKHHNPMVRQAIAVYRTCILAALTMIHAARDRRPVLIYRGAVSVGTYLISGTTVVGQAIDDAADAERLADAAIVWLLPAAQDVLEHIDLENDDLLIPWAVPLKGGTYLRTLAINPFALRKPAMRQRMADRMLDALDNPRVDVRAKRQATELFFDQCLRRSAEVAGTNSKE